MRGVSPWPPLSLPWPLPLASRGLSLAFFRLPFAFFGTSKRNLACLLSLSRVFLGVSSLSSLGSWQRMFATAGRIPKKRAGRRCFARRASSIQNFFRRELDRVVCSRPAPPEGGGGFNRSRAGRWALVCILRVF